MNKFQFLIGNVKFLGGIFMTTTSFQFLIGNVKIRSITKYTKK